MNSILTPALNHVYWIGGSPCSGKSSIAAALAAEFGFAIYSCDAAFYRHSEIVDPRLHPTFHRLSRASCDELWMRPFEIQVAEEVALYNEEFSLILNDLGAMPGDIPILAEGAALMPHLIDDLGISRDRAIWIVPWSTFQREHYSRREWRHRVLASCTDPAAAWTNWMERDIGFAGFVRDEAFRLERPCIVVDGAQSLDELTRVVRSQFGIGEEGVGRGRRCLPAGPGANSRGQPTVGEEQRRDAAGDRLPCITQSPAGWIISDVRAQGGA